MYKLIVCSVDDTLLTNNHTLSEDTKEALLQAQQAGARLALISRRSPQNLKKIAEKLQMNTYKGYIAACHGAFLQEMGSERVLRKKEVSLRLVDRIKALAEGQDVTLSIVENGCLYASGIDPYVQLEALLNDMRLCPWEAFEDISDTVLKLRRKQRLKRLYQLDAENPGGRNQADSQRQKYVQHCPCRCG